MQIATANSTNGIVPASPGLPSHSIVAPATASTTNAAIHGLRRPPTSAIAPNTGDRNAIASPAPAVAKPHSAWPWTGLAAIAEAKYGA